MCRRWRNEEIREYIKSFREMLGDAPKIHIFGIKVSSINCEVVRMIDSIDTMAWAFSKFKGGYGGTRENFIRYKTRLESKISDC